MSGTMASFFFTPSLGEVETFSHCCEGLKPLTLFRGVETPRNNFGRAYGTRFRHFKNTGT